MSWLEKREELARRERDIKRKKTILNLELAIVRKEVDFALQRVREEYAKKQEQKMKRMRWIGAGKE